MRFPIPGVLVATLALAASAADLSAVAPEDGGPRWPFLSNANDDASADSAGDSEPSSWLVQSPLANISWPKIEMPTIQFPAFSGEGPTLGERLGAPLQRLAARRNQFVQNTRESWNRTLERFRLGGGGDEAPRLAQEDSGPGLWGRLFGRAPEKEEGPRTVVEWMAQDRIDP